MEHTTRDRINATLAGHPWNVVPMQRADFAAWLCGLEEVEEGKGSLLNLTDGDAEYVEQRLVNTVDAGRLMNEWVGARHAARNQRTVEMLNEEAASWLR